MTTWQVAELFEEPYGKAASVNTAVSGFRATGLWPLDFGVFTDADYVAASTMDVSHVLSNTADKGLLLQVCLTYYFQLCK